MQPETNVAESVEEKLRKEIEELRRQLREQKDPGSSHVALSSKPWHPSPATLWGIFLAVTVLFLLAFLAGYIPLHRRQTLIRSEALGEQQALPRMEVIEVGLSSPKSELELPGSIEAITEAPILARASGYIKRRLADIGDRVDAGRPLAEIEAPEVDAQLAQAKADLATAQANVKLAALTAQRYEGLLKSDAVSKQEVDNFTSDYAAKQAMVASAEANVKRLEEMESFKHVYAPFSGVITQRNVDVGTLVNAGNTLLFRVAQTGTLRTYVNVPQTNANSIRLGQPAVLTVSSLPGRHFAGSVARTANALDPASRTMLVEIRVPNPDGTLFPGMYAQVDLSSSRPNPPLLIPGDALIVRAEGTEVALVRADHTVHFQKIQIGRDYGDKLEVQSGLQLGDMLIANPSDAVLEGVKVEPVPVETASEKTPAKNAGN